MTAPSWGYTTKSRHKQTLLLSVLTSYAVSLAVNQFTKSQTAQMLNTIFVRRDACYSVFCDAVLHTAGK